MRAFSLGVSFLHVVWNRVVICVSKHEFHVLENSIVRTVNACISAAPCVFVKKFLCYSDIAQSFTLHALYDIVSWILVFD